MTAPAIEHTRLDDLRLAAMRVTCVCGADVCEDCQDIAPRVHLARVARARNQLLLTRGDFVYLWRTVASRYGVFTAATGHAGRV